MCEDLNQNGENFKVQFSKLGKVIKSDAIRIRGWEFHSSDYTLILKFSPQDLVTTEHLQIH